MTKYLIGILSILLSQTALIEIVAKAASQEVRGPVQDMVDLIRGKELPEVILHVNMRVDLQQPPGCMIPPRYNHYLLMLEPQTSKGQTEADLMTFPISKPSFEFTRQIRTGIYLVTLKDQLHYKILSQRSFTIHDTQHRLTMPLPCGNT